MNTAKSLKIALLGYGKMGKEVEKFAVERGHIIQLTINDEVEWKAKGSQLGECDVAIEFTAPGIAVENLLKCFEVGIPVVCGTTGWYDRLNEVTTACNQKNGTLFYASNFSIGVNIFFEINCKLAGLMNDFPIYDIELEEIHHTQKLDAPSGTAIALAEGILQNIDRKTKWGNQSGGDHETLFIRSVREGSVPGTHIVTWDSEIDKIEIRHEAKSRKGFAMGATMAAEFISGKKGIFEMKDLLDL